MPLRILTALAGATCTHLLRAVPVQEGGALELHSMPEARFAFDGVIGERVSANIDGWLLPAPKANPAIIEMFRLRDRQPPPKLVDWAGEFAGKYLISAVQTLRLSDRADLRARVQSFVTELVGTQAEDGYLGPFPRAERLRGHWDLWGHYHVMQGLLLWHEHARDPVALEAVRRAADLICETYLDQPRRVFDAGSHEMNMAIHHLLVELYRITGEARYDRLSREIEKDWERAGDYLRTGLAGVEFYATPRPRWESLHSLEGLFARWRITGDLRYRQAFEHHWRSILRSDVHNAGSFSSGEQATGNPWAPGAIETCCTIAWMALSVDMLRLTGDPRVADELERSTFNGALGAQHPSGRWWSYNTPMDGVREASAQSIVFQARAGAPELNCCSVNGPRALGMLSDWAVMRDAKGFVVNWHAPGTVSVLTPDGLAVRLRAESELPRGGRVRWQVEFDGAPRKLSIRWRIPQWSTATTVRVNGAEARSLEAGTYFETTRDWRNGDSVEFTFEMAMRAIAGEREARGKVSLFRGPLLLAWDQAHNSFDEAGIPRIDLEQLRAAKLVESPARPLAPWALIELPGAGGVALRLCDYASAGASGTRYRSWLKTTASAKEAADEASVPGAEQRLVVSGQGFFPVALRLQDGRIAVVLRGGADHVGIKGRLDIVFSSDDGKTWTAPATVVDSPADDRNPAFGQAQDGALVVGFWRAAKDTYRDYDLEDPRQPTNTWVTRSVDAGKTWSEPTQIDVREIGYGSPYGKMITLPDGAMLMNIYGYGVRAPGAKLEAKEDHSYLYRSMDDGKSWARHGTIAAAFNETGLLRLADGTLLAAMRSAGGKANVATARSSDAGRTWSTPEFVSQPMAHPADLTLLPDGRVLLVTGCRVAPLGVRGLIGDARGKFNWEKRVLLVGDSTNVDTGYPSSVVRKEGRVLTFYYAVGSTTHPEWGVHCGVVEWQP